MATQANLDRVQQLYVAYYGRPAEQEGLDYWADRLEAEGESAIINAFGNSDEYAELSEGKGNATLVNNLYLQAFGRQADPEGLAYYTGVLASEEKSLAEIATTIINAAQGIDKHTFDAKVAAAAEYTAEFGSAEDYDLETAAGVVADADGGVYQPELTEAVETLNTAREALADFLASDAVDFDGNASTSAATEAEVRQNLTDAEAALEGDVVDSGSKNQLNANLQDAQAQLKTANDAIASTPGLRKAIADLQAAEAAQENAQEALASADSELIGREAAFTAANEGLTLEVDRETGETTYNGNAIFALNNNDELVIVQGVDFNGINALLSEVQSYLADAEAAQEADDALQAATTRVDDLDGQDELAAFEAAQTAVSDAEEALENRTELETDVAEAQALVDELDELEGNIEEAEEAIADLGVDLYGANTLDDDTDNLYIFDAETGTAEGINDNDFAGDSLFFIGDAFSRVDLKASDVLTDKAFGNTSALEVFFQQSGSDVELFFETEAFQGNATNGFEGDTITLTGVNIEDLQLENGYISIA